MVLKRAFSRNRSGAVSVRYPGRRPGHLATQRESAREKARSQAQRRNTEHAKPAPIFCAFLANVSRSS